MSLRALIDVTTKLMTDGEFRNLLVIQPEQALSQFDLSPQEVEALERRDPALAERLAREHTLGLAAHVEQHGDFLDGTRE